MAYTLAKLEKWKKFGTKNVFKNKPEGQWRRDWDMPVSPNDSPPIKNKVNGTLIKSKSHLNIVGVPLTGSSNGTKKM